MIEFLLFFVYTAIIFFLPSTWWVIGGCCAITLAYCLVRRIQFIEVVRGTVKIAPFILLTFGLSVWLDRLQSAVFVALKLLIVCCTTLVYSQTLSPLKFAGIVDVFLSPLRKFGFDVDGVCLIICLALSLASILRREITETKYAMRAKNMNLGMRNFYHITTDLLTRLIKRIDELDLALRAKGVF